MAPADQTLWMETHIPHRVRAAIARLPGMEQSILRVRALINPPLPTVEHRIYWRCATDSIWEGRLAATRWLIEFVGIKQNLASGQAVEAKKLFRNGISTDVRIDDIAGGALIAPQTTDGTLLANVWKGCSQASGHATYNTNHPPVNEQQLAEVLTIIMDHLQKTVYDAAGKNIRDSVLTP